MGKLLISAGTSGITSDEVTASKADVLAGKMALTSDSNDEAVAGTLPDKTGTIQEGAAALDSTNARVTFAIPATGKYTGTSKLFATYARIASLIGLTAAKIMKGNTILNIAGTATSDANAVAANILKGNTAYVNGGKVTGTMKHITNDSGIRLSASNSTVVVPADSRYIDNNTDGVRRVCIRYNKENGYIYSNTLFGLPAQTKTVTPSTSVQNIYSDANKLLEKVTVNAIPSNYKKIEFPNEIVSTSSYSTGDGALSNKLNNPTYINIDSNKCNPNVSNIKYLFQTYVRPSMWSSEEFGIIFDSTQVIEVYTSYNIYNNNSDCVCIRLIKNSDKYMFEFCPVKIYSGATTNNKNIEIRLICKIWL